MNVVETIYNYQLVTNWPDLPNGFKLGNPTGIGIDSYQNILVFHRANRRWSSSGSMPKLPISSKTILTLDRNSGKIIDSWGENLFIMPHGLTVDMNNNIWVTDVGSHQVFKFSHQGKLLMQLGEAGVPGNDSTHFNLPTDVAITRDGSFYVTDGYGNNRVVKFSSTGQYLFEWGEKGENDAQFNLPHAIDLDDEENIYIADRENNRVQVFDSTGKFLANWRNKSFGKISSVVVEKKQKGYVAVDFFVSGIKDGHYVSNIIFFNPSGNFVSKLEQRNFENKSAGCWYHNVLTDNQENIYVTDIIGNSIKKYVKIQMDYKTYEPGTES